jgi:ketosteroid isomerase-like protein
MGTATDNAELVRRFNQSWSSGDLEAVLESAHPDMEFDWSDSMGPFAGVYAGHAGLRRFWTEMWDAWDEFSIEIDDVTECAGGRVVTATTVRARGKGSGIEIEATGGAMVWTVRDGKVVKGKLYQTAEEALAAGAIPA